MVVSDSFKISGLTPDFVIMLLIFKKKNYRRGNHLEKSLRLLSGGKKALRRVHTRAIRARLSRDLASQTLD